MDDINLALYSIGYIRKNAITLMDASEDLFTSPPTNEQYTYIYNGTLIAHDTVGDIK